MKSKTSWKLTWLSALAAIASMTFLEVNPYTNDIKLEVEVVDKYQGTSRHGIETAMVLREVASGRMFDSEVSLTTYTRFGIGDRIIWTTTNSQRDRDGGQIALLMIASMTALIGVLGAIIGWAYSSWAARVEKGEISSDDD